MSETGMNIVDGFRVLRRFCKEVYLLLKTADGLMQGDGWTPIPRASVVGYTSTVIDEWDWWLPIEFVRHYEHAKSKRRHLVPYVAVLLDDPEEPTALSETLISAGWIDYGAGKTRGEPDRENYYWLCRWHLWMPDRDDHGRLCSDGNPRQTWHGEKLPPGVVRATSFAYPLDEITTSETLGTKIVAPLLAGIAKGITQHSNRDSRDR